MSVEISEGGFAFPSNWVDFQPTTGEQVVRVQFPGMTLRDYFAGRAIVGIEATGISYNPDALAKNAYLLADAMLDARKQNP